ncbi:hypothetical protein ZYGR_0W00770 [Zygosaccharomyces rouxii]|uniref:ER membrane protein complex subunit 1 n=2 Tax=Zygosaccharomyces rouxii TaxID=4956 RepID=C5DZ38_ZYGRC|nr:uncharacterized protein ZYRO0F17952g [Zygosaccharomyces rouxii]KAH9201240.1 hypothetical protein LQ764DRAFT_76760 [Zygosaccharomyces rouxii]GAV50551.1 hypothetical protein ZYGR_0W00770 [Zygosaccharomyces rouxii]CAQ43325.1 Uncharacterized endoplasmic reticulum membrane protein YCL045C [Zygosaccharomyces rouxii]CAR29049.1 ZYRO0F17952p [Zygosaccharomyces rouxii]
MYFLSLLLLLLSANVQAIYSDEAFVNDWQLQNVGEYQCVFENDNSQYLITLSQLGQKSLLSFINEVNGEVFFRQPLDFSGLDVMVVDNGSEFVIMDDNSQMRAFNGSNGFPLEKDVSEYNFKSSCQPDMKGFKLKDKTLQVLDPESQLVVFKVDLWDNFQRVEYIHTDFQGTLKVLYSTTDSKYVFQFVENGELISEWVRDESESDIVAHAVINLPDSSLDAISQELVQEEDTSTLWEAYKFRVSKNLQRFKDLLRKYHYSPGAMLTEMLKTDDDASKEQRELVFGLAKYLVVATQRGKISALNIKNGIVEWSVQSNLNDIILLEWFADSSELVAVDRDGLYEFYDLTDLSQPTLIKKDRFGSTKIDTISLLDGQRFFITTEDDQKSIVSLSSKGEKPLTSTFISTHDKNHIYGHVVTADGQLRDTWVTTLDDDEEILSFAKREDTPTVSLGHILGNRTVLYKYLYPNLVSYAVYNKKTGNLFIHLIDSVNGALLHSQVHDDGVDPSSPIELVFGENWFVYSYFSSQPIPEQKLAVVELYESLEPDHRVSDNSTQLNPLKGVHPPEVITQAYFFPEVIKRMQLSDTKFGITTKSIVLELESGQLIYLSKALLNARRKDESQMSDDDKKEFMAMPYFSTLPINDHFIITHIRHLIMGSNSKLISIPTNLESTSIVCSLGHDIFCGKIAPSGQFDIMSPTFEKGKLIATIVGLVFLCYFIRPSVEAKKLKSSWMVRN